MVRSITKSCREVEIEQVGVGGSVSAERRKCGRFHGASIAGSNGAEIRERTYKRPDIVRRNKEDVREIEGCILLAIEK